MVKSVLMYGIIKEMEKYAHIRDFCYGSHAIRYEEGHESAIKICIFSEIIEIIKNNDDYEEKIRETESSEWENNSGGKRWYCYFVVVKLIEEAHALRNIIM